MQDHISYAMRNTEAVNSLIYFNAPSALKDWSFLAIELIILTGTLQQVAFVFMGLAAVAFFDAATYARAKTAVVPHIGAGIAALIVAFIALQGQAS